MIPLIDDYLQAMIVEKLRFLKANPQIIDLIFTTGKRDTLAKLRDFIEVRKIKVVIGYPKDQNSLPCYVITLAPENEQPIGLGDDGGTFDDYDFGVEEDEEGLVEEAEKAISEFLASTYMNSNYRIECWSDNGDLTAYMYVILKWCLWSSRQEMLKMGWVNIRVNGTDLEPVPDYMPTFIYRRAAQVNLMYENLYFEEIAKIKDYSKIIDKPDDFHKDDDGNIVDKDDNIIIPNSYTWILRAHYYEKTIGDEEKDGDEFYSKEYIFKKEETLETSIRESLPEVGRSNVRYLVAMKDKNGEITSYAEYFWIDGKYQPIGMSANADFTKYATVDVVDKKDKVTLEKANSYTDTSTDEVKTSEMGATNVNDIFNSVFKK